MLNDDITLENMEVKTPSPLSSPAVITETKKFEQLTRINSGRHPDSVDHSPNEEGERKRAKSGSSSGDSSLSDLRRRLQDLPSPNEAARLANRVISISRRLSQKRDFHFYGTTSCIEEEEEERTSLPTERLGESKTKDARARRRAKIRLEAAIRHTMVVPQPNEAEALELDNSFNKPSSTMDNDLDLPPLAAETPKSVSRYSQLSEETLLGSSRTRQPAKDSSRLQRNQPLLSEDSPKGAIELQSLASPVSLGRVRPTKFGGYRPHTGLILQNLSSGSEPDTCLEMPADAIVCKQIASPALSNDSVRSFNVRSLSTASSSNAFDDPALNGSPGSITVSPILKIIGRNSARNSNGRFTSTPLSSWRKEEASSFRLLETRRKQSTHSYDRQPLRTPSSFPEVNIHDVSSRISEVEDLTIAQLKAVDFEKSQPNEVGQRKHRGYDISSRSENSSRKPVFKHSQELESKVGVASCRSKDTKFLSARIAREETIASSPFRTYMSEGDAASSREFKEFFSQRDSSLGPEKGGRESTESDVPDPSNYVPTLALNSQEVSSSASPASRGASEKHLNANVLISALSNVSLKQRASVEPRSADSRASSRRFENSGATEGQIGMEPNGKRTKSDAFYNVRSKIPVRISSNRNKMAFRRFLASEEEAIEGRMSSKEQRCATQRTRNSGRTYSLTDDSSTRQHTQTEDECKEEIQNRTHGASNRSLTNPSTNQNTTRSSSSSDTEEEDKRTSLEARTDSSPSESEPIESCFASLSVEEPKGEDSLSFAYPRRLEAYRGRHTEAAKPSLIEKQIGDGKCQQALRKISSNSSLEMDKTPKSHEKVRFSWEKLAAEQFRRNLSTDQTKTQSETAAFLKNRFYEAASLSLTHSSSTSKVRPRESPKFRRKSQDRFPFTISEKPSTASMKFKVSRRLERLDSKSPNRTYELNIHPSITRLAGSGFEETPDEIMTYVVYSEREDVEVRSSGMKGLVRRFSAKLRRSKKRDKVRPNRKPTRVIYENRDYQGDSMVDSCSESSLLKEFKACERTLDSMDERIMKAREGDDAWVGELGHKEALQMPEEKCEERRDPCEMFYAKSAQETSNTSTRPSMADEEQKLSISTDRRRRNRVKFRSSSLAVGSKTPDENVHRKLVESRNLKNSGSNRNSDGGCLCLRFYRMIVPVSFNSLPRYRRWVNRSKNRSSIKKKSRLSPQKGNG